MSTVQNIIEITNLVKQYPKASKPALQGVDLAIPEGEFFGLIGPNGSGKTTMISILCGLRGASSGEAKICNHSVIHNINKVLPEIGLVPQDIALYQNLTLTQNLTYFGYLYGLNKKLIKKRIDKYLTITRLRENAKDLVQDFSGGMKRRANLAAGLLHEPKVIFLDEPTVGVDTLSRHMLFDGLEALNDEKKTFVYTTHYLEEIERLCSRIAIIHKGKIVDQGTSDEVIAHNPGCNNLGDVFVKLIGTDLSEEDDQLTSNN